MVELRKRKAPPATSPVDKKGKKDPATISKQQSKPKTVSTIASDDKLKTGDTITLDGFGGQIKMNDGTDTALKDLVGESKSGVVLFTYPRASTPGCTKQACLFRDDYDNLTSTGLLIYGLSTDSPKANTTFKTKQNLPFPLLCDPSSTLISALGLNKMPKGTTRGVFAVNKEGKVLLLQAGGPDATVEAVRQLLALVSESEGQKTKVTEAKSD